MWGTLSQGCTYFHPLDPAQDWGCGTEQGRKSRTHFVRVAGRDQESVLKTQSTW